MSDILTIQGDLDLFKIELYNTVGRLVRSVQANHNIHNIEVSSLPAGVYILKIINRDGNQMKTQKLVIE